jgi:hypothetical protein
MLTGSFTAWATRAESVRPVSTTFGNRSTMNGTGVDLPPSPSNVSCRAPIAAFGSIWISISSRSYVFCEGSILTTTLSLLEEMRFT